MKVRFAEPAEFDLEQLADAIARTDPQRAKIVTERLKVAVRDIGRAPLLHSPIRGNLRLRKRLVRPYVMLFEVTEDHILILRVAHERSDWVSLI